MYEEEINFEKLLLKQSETCLAHLTTVTLTFDPVSPKSLWFHCYPEWVCRPSLRKVTMVKAFSSYWSETVLGQLVQVTLTFNPVTPKSIGFLCYPRWFCGPSLRKVGQGVLELFIVSEKVTDGPTDWPTDMCKAICPLFFEGGHKKCVKSRIQSALSANKNSPI